MDSIAISIGTGLTSAFIFWIGIIAFERGLRRFGAHIRLPYLKVFLGLFVSCTIIALLLDGGQRLGFVGAFVLFAGIIVWISSFIGSLFRRNKQKN